MVKVKKLEFYFTELRNILFKNGDSADTSGMNISVSPDTLLT
jgi:hypothetical protein